MIREFIVVSALALAAKAQSVELDTNIALYILCGILGVSALICLLLVVCIIWLCCIIIWSNRLERNQECSDVGGSEKLKKTTDKMHTGLSLPMHANPAFEQCTPPGNEGVASTNFACSPILDSLSDLNMDQFHQPTATDKVAESPTTPTTPQGYDRTPLLSRQADAGNPRSIPAIQVEGEQTNLKFTTSSPNPKITPTSITPRSRPKSQEHRHITGVSPIHLHRSTPQPGPVHQSHLKDVEQAQGTPRTKRAQRYMDHVGASLTPKSKRHYSPAIARKMAASDVKGSESEPKQLKMKSLHSDTKKAMERNYRQQHEEEWNETLAYLEDALQSI